MSSNPNDHPFDEVVKSALDKIAWGFEIHQKWTCDYCNSRNEMEVPNKFFPLGLCKQCKKVTDIKRRGCNYSAQIMVPKIKN